MIIRQLQNTENMSDIEKQIAKYILDNGEKVVKMTARELAEATYTSSSSVLRFCDHIDDKGFFDFKLQLSRELNDARQNSLSINVNAPYHENDSMEKIADIIQDMCISSIKETRESMSLNAVKNIVLRMKQADTIDIYGMGSSFTVANEFKDKMIRIGKHVRLEGDAANQTYQALNSNTDNFAILISHSGMTRNIIEVAKILKENKVPILVITSEGDNPLTQYANYVLRTATSEEKTFLYKMDNTCSQVAVSYILNCIFACYYEMDYEENRARTTGNENKLKNLKLR